MHLLRHRREKCTAVLAGDVAVPFKPLEVLANRGFRDFEGRRKVAHASRTFFLDPVENTPAAWLRQKPHHPFTVLDTSHLSDPHARSPVLRYSHSSVKSTEVPRAGSRPVPTIPRRMVAKSRPWFSREPGRRIPSRRLRFTEKSAGQSSKGRDRPSYPVAPCWRWGAAHQARWAGSSCPRFSGGTCRPERR